MDSSIEIQSFKLSPKAIVTLVIVVAVVLLVWQFYGEIRDLLGLGDETTSDKGENADQVADTIAKENRKRKLRKPNSKEQGIAQQLFKAMDWYNTDENTIYKSFEGLSPNEVRLVVEAYGTKRLLYSGQQWTLLGKDTVGTLIDHLKLVLDEKEYNVVRPWLIAAGFETKPKK